jgi:uncharacterized membrane protein
MLRVLGIIVAVLGVVTVIYATFYMQPGSFRIQQGPEELGVAEGETRFTQLGVAVVGIGLIYLGYRVFKYIPPSERERELVTELDVEGDQE